MTKHFTLSRRVFLTSSLAATGALALGFRVPANAEEAAGATSDVKELNAWVVVNPDDTVLVRISRCEMGQGTLTGLAQLIAEELEADWDKVTWEYPSPGQSIRRERVWGNFGTYGSQGIRNSQQYVREGGAAARMMLMQAAANRWGVDVSAVKAAKNVVTGPDGATLTYGDLALEAAQLEVPTEIKLKDPADWTLAGKSLKRLDTEAKLDGSQIYAVDVKLPGMVSAAIRQAPVIGATVASFDADAVMGMPGVKKVVQLDDYAVAVVADTFWRAKTALEALPIEWDEGENATLGMADIHASLDEGLGADQAFIGTQRGDVKKAVAEAAKVVEADYYFPWQHHATMEPMNATALVSADSAEIWVATQDPEGVLAITAEAADLDILKCEVHRLHLGGGFGRRASSHEYARQAVLLAKEMPGTPVKLIWTREEDMIHGTFHPITKARFVGALDADGNVTGMHMRISGQSIRAGLMPHAMDEKGDPMVFQGLNEKSTEGEFGYTIPNLLIDHALRQPPLRPGYWRGVNNNQNAFYLESFIDEMAHAAGKDPYQFRRGLLKDHPLHLRVLDAVAEGIGWDKPAPEGVFRGICQHHGYGSYVAAAAEVSVDERGSLKIHRIVASTDCGHVVNPQQVEAQIEGSFAFGLSAALHGEITVEDGRVQQQNFDTYPPMRMDEFPKVESLLRPTGGFWGGVGEPTIFVAAPAVTNAIFAATGKRVRQLPLSNHDLSA
ncbi:molybdopterin cofactor-binding domain-containing protein [Mesorhizobium sp. KR2-14]|uniref:xanthine dehydrogenase family protein molybdopterin-binding subunit n=1 Tax=Mesorhizobium sp. KR2-14 TaxID=3156610 RepID=UPI0032B4B0B5